MGYGFVAEDMAAICLVLLEGDARRPTTDLLRAIDAYQEKMGQPFPSWRRARLLSCFSGDPSPEEVQELLLEIDWNEEMLELFLLHGVKTGSDSSTWMIVRFRNCAEPGEKAAVFNR